MSLAPSQDDCGSLRRALLLCAVLALTLLGLVGYIAYNENEETNKSSKQTMAQTDVNYYYGHFFRTQSQQKRFEEKFFNDDNNTVETPTQNATDMSVFNSLCNGTETPRPTSNSTASPIEAITRLKRSPGHRRFHGFYKEGPRHHGCCTSRRKFITPPTAISDDDGTILTLLHFGDNDRQYFLSQDCWHNRGCPLRCGCRQQMGLYNALVLNPNYFWDTDGELKYVVRTIRIPGGCKCMNGLSSPFWLP